MCNQNLTLIGRPDSRSVPHYNQPNGKDFGRLRCACVVIRVVVNRLRIWLGRCLVSHSAVWVNLLSTIRVHIQIYVGVVGVAVREAENRPKKTELISGFVRILATEKPTPKWSVSVRKNLPKNRPKNGLFGVLIFGS